MANIVNCKENCVNDYKSFYNENIWIRKVIYANVQLGWNVLCTYSNVSCTLKYKIAVVIFVLTRKSFLEKVCLPNNKTKTKSTGYFHYSFGRSTINLFFYEQNDLFYCLEMPHILCLGNWNDGIKYNAHTHITSSYQHHTNSMQVLHYIYICGYVNGCVSMRMQVLI